MSKDNIKNKLHEIIDSIEDESALNMLMEDAVLYQTKNHEEADADGLTETQWASLREAQQQIEDGNCFTHEEMKNHFAKWLSK